LLQRLLKAGKVPAEAIEHAERLLIHDPDDQVALQAADKLLGVRSVASRAASLLRDSRLSRSRPPRK
jgi:hypothetical protein